MISTTAMPDGDAAAGQQEVIRLEGLGKRFGEISAVEDVTLSIRRGEIFVILGGPGCGETTLLGCPRGSHEPGHRRLLRNAGAKTTTTRR